ncbi:MAG: hypothetical protein K2P45_04270 [Eubacterium sp.]|nr:hypothetical protein [Eubacterium sp.]
MTMTNKEKYKRAFSTLHASANISLEAEDMEKRKNGKQFKKAAAACVAAAFVFGSISIAYAADIGGIQRKLTTWLYGQRQEVSISGDGKGNYTYTYTDENGQQQESGAGGIAIDEDGNEIPLSAEAVMDMVSNEVKADADGRIWIYYYDKKFEITDLFDTSGVCRVSIVHHGTTEYFKIESGNEEEGAMPGSYSFQSSADLPVDDGSYTKLN